MGRFEWIAAIASNRILRYVGFGRKAMATMGTLQEKEAMQNLPFRDDGAVDISKQPKMAHRVQNCSFMQDDDGSKSKKHRAMVCFSVDVHGIYGIMRYRAIERYVR